MTRIHLATGLAVRSDGCVLLVASRYANHPAPLWNLPGGRQEPGELLCETVVREVREETGMLVRAGELAYVSESYAGDVQVLNATFHVAIESQGEPSIAPDHIVEFAWVPHERLAERIVVAVVREPLLAYLRGELPARYAAFHDAGITIQWPNDSP